MSDAPVFTAKQLAECAEREAKMRERVYPRWVADGRMKAEKANRETAMMHEIAAHFRLLIVEDIEHLI